MSVTLLPELAILNYMMPEYSGDEVARRIRQSACLGHIPLILESASIPKPGSSECQRLFEQDGFTAMLCNPMGVEDLLNAIIQAMQPEQPTDYRLRIF